MAGRLGKAAYVYIHTTQHHRVVADEDGTGSRWYRLNMDANYIWRLITSSSLLISEAVMVPPSVTTEVLGPSSKVVENSRST